MSNRYRILGMRPGRAGFGEGLLAAAVENASVVGLGLDITASVGMDLFAQEFPERFFSIGIAEQNAMAIAAGLALSGKIPVLSTYGVFSAFRAADQLRISICYNNLHVLIGGAHAGISVGPDGATHQALEDISLLRAIPNMTILSPCDATQANLATQSALKDCHGPVYVRYGREAVPDFSGEALSFEPGKAQIMKGGEDVAIIATGHMVWEALTAAYILEDQHNISASVINIHTIKPLDVPLILQEARRCKAIVTAEEHQIFGGLGGAIAEVLARHMPCPVEMIGIQNQFGESGKPEELMTKHGLTSTGIMQACFNVIKRREEG